MFGEISLMALMSSAIIFVVGGGIGYFTARQIKDKHTLQLEEDLQTAQSSLKDYQGNVNRHFLKTSLLFNKLTDNYREVYEHLATGAQSLCNEKPDTAALNLPEAKILSSTATAATAITAAVVTDVVTSAMNGATTSTAAEITVQEGEEPSKTEQDIPAQLQTETTNNSDTAPMETAALTEHRTAEEASPEPEQKIDEQEEQAPSISAAALEMEESTPTISAEELKALEASEKENENADEIHLGAESTPSTELDHHKTHPAIH
ncbi:MAG: DUF1043 family protein [Ectothiorhodospiraceae bacterium]|nr:DUF1043 family protein [Ectothiorhodospiraceae bacterium]